MTTFWLLSVTTMAVTTAMSKNPVKISMILMIMSATMFSMCSLSSGQTWMPMLFFLLFMGGILMMFLILSSLAPNEPLKKKGKLLSVILLPTLMMSSGILGPMNWTKETYINPLQIKEYLGTNQNLIFLTLLILMYFLMFVSMLSESKTSLRVEN